MITPEQFNQRGVGHLPGHLGIDIVGVSPNEIRSCLTVTTALMAPNGFLHAGSVVTLADTSCGYGCVANLPAGASGFTTIELKANFLGTAREGAIRCRATPVHLGRNTQVWDAVVQAEGGERPIALFRCTQMVLWQNPKP